LGQLTPAQKKEALFKRLTETTNILTRRRNETKLTASSTPFATAPATAKPLTAAVTVNLEDGQQAAAATAISSAVVEVVTPEEVATDAGGSQLEVKGVKLPVLGPVPTNGVKPLYGVKHQGTRRTFSPLLHIAFHHVGSLLT